MNSVGVTQSRRRLVCWLFCCTLWAASAVDVRAEPDAEGGAFTGNAFCGPRAVQRVLAHYGIDVDLATLVHETQWPVVEQGASMDSLSKALETRSIHTAVVSLPGTSEIAWPHPAIVHLAFRKQEHYVVWLPGSESDDSPMIWDGARSPAVMHGDVNQLRSGPVLLTSPNPIPDSAIAAHQSAEMPAGPSLLTFVSSVSASFVCGLLLAHLRPFPRKPAHPPHPSKRNQSCPE